ncbi:MAG: hypothetical protein QXG39_00515 [Candidatus Aenigmatarchaeota archaeon]
MSKKYSYFKSKLNQSFRNHVDKLKKWKYKNLTAFGLSILLAYFVVKSEVGYWIEENLGYLGYFSAFIAGMLFSFSLTTPPATALIFSLGRQFNPFLIALIGASGSVLSDYLIFKFFRDRLMDEIKLLHEEVNNFLANKHLSRKVPKELRFRLWLWQKTAHSKFKWFVPVIAGFIIASPLPDEIGVALVGAAKMNTRKFIPFSYLLNFLGIITIAGFGKGTS